MLKGRISPGLRSTGESTKSAVVVEDVVDSLAGLKAIAEVARVWDGDSEDFESWGLMGVAGIDMCVERLDGV